MVLYFLLQLVLLQLLLDVKLQMLYIFFFVSVTAAIVVTSYTTAANMKMLFHILLPLLLFFASASITAAYGAVASATAAAVDVLAHAKAT